MRRTAVRPLALSLPVLSVLLLSSPAPARAQGRGGPVGSIAASRLSELSQAAARVFRGRCTGAEVGEATVGGGARVRATTYTFEVSDTLKGPAGRTVSFRQVGTPAGGPLDLGEMAGLPVYRPGEEYVLFLLPPGPRSGLTSPAGAAEGAFAVAGEDLHSLGPGHLARVAPPPAPGGPGRAAATAAAAPAVPLTWGAVRAAVAREVGR